MSAPLAIVRSSLVMMPQLEAEEALQLATRLGVGTGSMSKDGIAKTIRAWRKAARVEAEPVKRPGPTDLSAIGIGVRKVKRRG